MKLHPKKRFLKGKLGAEPVHTWANSTGYYTNINDAKSDRLGEKSSKWN